MTDCSNGQLTTGSWIMKGYGVYEGTFEYQRPIGKGTFKFASGQVQTGEFVVAESSTITAIPNNDQPTQPKIGGYPNAIGAFILFLPTILNSYTPTP
jgi:hypothetical protein